MQNNVWLLKQAKFSNKLSSKQINSKQCMLVNSVNTGFKKKTVV